jgi:hypothetical protein
VPLVSWRPWTWWLADQRVALRNARHASAALAQRRSEREEVDAFLSRLEQRGSGPH